MSGEGTGGSNGSPRPSVAVPASPGGDNMTLNFSISLPGNNGSGTTTGAEQTVQVSVSLSRSPSARQLVGAATTDNILATAPVSAPAFSQILEADEAPLGPSATEEHYHVSSEGWDEEGQQAEATYAYEGDGDYDTGMSAQSTNYEYPAEAALAEEASTSVPLDPQQSEGDVDIGQSEGLEGQGGEGDYDYTREVAVSQQQQEAYTDEGGPGQDGYGEPTRYEEATGSQDVYGGGGDEYHMAEAGLQAQDGEGYGNEDGEEMVSPVYRRKSAGLSVATQQDARVYVAPPDALSPTSYDYNKDMWGDLWAYDAPNPAEAASALQDAGVGEEESDDEEGDENLGDDFEDSPWRPPSHDKAKEYRAKAVFEEGSAPLCRGVHLSDLGLGITLYFRFLKALIALFSLLLLLAVPSFSLYSSGSRIPPDKRDALGLYASTLGNLGTLGEDGRYVAFLGGSALSLSSAGSVIGTMDLFSSIAYALMVLAMGWEVRRRTRKGTALTAKEFAVYVTGFPRDARKEAIIEHFSGLYPLNDFDWKGRPPALGRLREPVRDTANSSDERYVGKWVCEVTLARRNGRKLRTFLLNDEKTLQLKRIRAHMKMYSPNTPLLDGRGASEDQYQAFEKKLNELGAEMETIAERLAKDKQLARVEKDCVGAFVIFEFVESKQRCLQDYSWTNVNQWCRYPKPLLFQNHRLTVRPAADPEDVWWENLEVSSWERFLRRSVANVVMAVFLIVSFAVVISLTGAKQRQTANAPKLSFCAKEVPALFLGSYANSTSGLSLVSPSPFDCAECDTQCSELWPNAGYVVYSYHDSALRPARPYSLAACLASPCPDPSRASQCPCVVPSGNAMCSTLACSQPTEGHRCQSFKSRTLAGCYCSFRLDSLVASSGYLSALLSLLRDNLCSSFATSIGLSMGLQVLLSVSTLAVNALLTHVTHSLTSFEHNASSDTQAAQVIRKVFVASFLNTALLLLLAYGSLQGSGPLVRAVRGVGILAGQYSDFSVNWYADVGVQLCVTSLIAALSPHIQPLLQYFVLLPLQRLLARRAAASGRPSHVMQADLNTLYVGPRFDVTERYPQVLNLLFFTMTFSTGLPLMTLFALISFILCYTVDRFLLLRFYRRPPQRDERLQRTINHMLPYALLLHLGIAVWMLGNAEILHGDTTAGSLLSESLSSGRSVAERIVRPYVFPLFLFWVLLLLYLVAVDVLPSQTLSNALTAFKSLLKGAQAQAQSSGALLANGYTKVFERELPRDFKPEDLAGPDGKWAGWATCTYDDGSSVLRKLRGAPGTSRHGKHPKSPDMSAAAAAASPNGRALYRRTWEVIKVNALHTYALSRNPKYRGAVMTFFKEFQQQKQQDAES